MADPSLFKRTSSNSGIPFGTPLKTTEMLLLALTALAAFSFWILFKCIDWFEKI